ncbi:MAG: chaperonin GroL [Candidatus Blackburnbacteria bacterium RIFCSPHIGHO2_01_FULL_43_15b]|uniref:Chaperonin GroEL n=1 Tax=Candidatus Blackburnbacteria bacterium RIFCSPHIGHO2_01_FULL_43_15b TaxID=1797513 RepID=A0A1G1V3K0_9BACT|nr:MAG: chaperonin GroL [Candidatus Blackburnbacteria bacterium RIFCSPHIGHO2_01_FULL_43_15b]
MAKQLLFGKNARTALLSGIDQLARAVVTTLGPKGRNVAIDRKWGAPRVIHDGVSVAKEVELKDPFENMGAQLIREASSKTNDVAGDGTTTATLLAQVITQEGIKRIEAEKDPANPMVLKRGIEKGVVAVLAEVGKVAKPVKNKEEIEQVATNSAQNGEIGKIIAEALERVGNEGVVTVEEGKGLTIEVEYKEGMEFDRGYASAYFVTNPERMEAEIDSPRILITDKKISAISDLLPFLENTVKVSKNIVIIADEIEGEALAVLVVNKLKGTFSVLAVKAPGFGDRRREMLEDVATLTGGTVISEDTGRTLESVTLDDLGTADKVWSDKDNTRIIGGKGDKGKIDARIAQIKRGISETDSDFDREKLHERLAKLAGGVAQINVGAATEVELNEKKERVKDAVEATKAAREEGIVPGGGVTLLRAREVIKGVNAENKDEQAGLDILYAALEQPIRWILKNAGEKEDEVVGKVLASKDSAYGFNVMSEKYENMLEAGILDPAKVVRSVVQNSASVAMMVLTTEGLVATEPEPEKPIPGGMGGMDY